MMTTSMRNRLAALCAAPFAVLMISTVAHGQDAPIQNHDVAGVAVTTADMLGGPGTVKSFTCPVAWGVRDAADDVARRLDARTYAYAHIREEASPEAVEKVHALLRGDGRGARREVVAALAPAGVQGTTARQEAGRLAAHLDGMLANLQTVDPKRPGFRYPTQMASAVDAYNKFVNVSSARYMADPADEFRVIRGILSELIVASLAHEGRTEFAADAGQGDVLDCAPPAPAIPPTPTPPPVAVRICVMLDDDLRWVAGVVIPETGDTMAIVNGDRRPFADVYPDRGQYAAGRPELVERVSFGTEEYVPVGLPFVVEPEEMRPIGQIDGVRVFTRRAQRGTVPTAIFLPMRQGCVVQEYRPVERVREVRG
jgi:hypothetical protein